MLFKPPGLVMMYWYLSFAATGIWSADQLPVPGSVARSRALAVEPPVKSPKTCTREALGAQTRNLAVPSAYNKLPMPSLFGEGERIGTSGDSLTCAICARTTSGCRRPQ